MKTWFIVAPLTCLGQNVDSLYCLYCLLTDSGCQLRPINPIIWLFVLYLDEEGICPIYFFENVQ